MLEGYTGGPQVCSKRFIYYISVPKYLLQNDLHNR